MTGPNERERPDRLTEALPRNSFDGEASSSRVSQTSRRRDASLDLAEYVEHFRARVLQDALTEALRSTWLRRADAFEAAIHQPGDFPGQCSVGQIEANNRRLAQKAQACRNHASVCIFQDSGAICEHLRGAA